jgi:hypothetical protein
MRKIIKAAVLTLVLSIPVWAGEIGMPIAPPSGEMGAPIAPPPQGREAQASSEPAKTGDIGCPITTDVGLSLLQSLLALI